jgi:hypothetical protein
MSTTTTYRLSWDPACGTCPVCFCCDTSCPCPLMPTTLHITLFSLDASCYPSVSGCATPSNFSSFVGHTWTMTYYATDPGTIGGVGFLGAGWYAQEPTFVSAEFCPGGVPNVNDMVMFFKCSRISDGHGGFANVTNLTVYVDNGGNLSDSPPPTSLVCVPFEADFTLTVSTICDTFASPHSTWKVTL